MPYPQSLAMALEVEAIVRARGATPATIALIDGVLRVGLDRAALEAFAARSGSVKVSRRDLAAAIVRRDTGGIGGVHRGAAETFDVSADLTELGRTPVAVVCAGAKSILDLAKTLEYLETQGVPVLGYGSDEFPAFFSRTSGLRVDHRFDSAAELARVIATQFFRLGFKQGILIANPIAAEDALAPAQIDARIALAVADADAAGVTRKDLTPYLLGRINELTGGASLTANIALVKQNASLAARIAVELARIG